MSKVWDRHIEYLEAVNNAKTEEEHSRANLALRAFREGVQAALPDWHFGCDSDLHYLDQGINRPMCCGVWLDWKPAEVTA